MARPKLILTPILKDTVMISATQTGKLRLREMTYLPQGHIASSDTASLLIDLSEYKAFALSQ
jgi:hypothetical protein